MSSISALEGVLAVRVLQRYRDYHEKHCNPIIFNNVDRCLAVLPEEWRAEAGGKMKAMSNFVVDLHIKGYCLRFLMREKPTGLVALGEAVDILTHAGFDVNEGSYRLARPQDNYRELTPELAELAKALEGV